MNLNYRSCRTCIPRKRRGKHTHTHTKVFRKEKQTIEYLVGFHFGRDMSPSEEVKGDPANESKTISLVCQYSDFYFNSSVRYRWSAHQGSMHGKKVRQKANLLLINQTMLLL